MVYRLATLTSRSSDATVYGMFTAVSGPPCILAWASSGEGRLPGFPRVQKKEGNSLDTSTEWRENSVCLLTDAVSMWWLSVQEFENVPYVFASTEDYAINIYPVCVHSVKSHICLEYDEVVSREATLIV